MLDAKTSYPLSAEIYTGIHDTVARSKGIAHELVLRLCKDYMFLGANITMNSFFTSYKLANDLIDKDTTIVGMIRLNNRELPEQFASSKEAAKRGPHKSMFCFSNSCELVSYTSRTRKNVCLLSTAHATEDINADTRKPLIIHDYNEHKGDVDKLLRRFTCKQKSNRWPMLIFYNMIDVAALAAYRSYALSHPAWKVSKHDKRKVFLKELAMELAENYLQKRANNPKTSQVRMALDLIGYTAKKAQNMPAIQVNNKRRRCEFCKGSKSEDNKTSAVCDQCLKPTCPLHYVRSCEQCYMNNFNSDTMNESEKEDDEGDHNAQASVATTSAATTSTATTDTAAKRCRK